MCPDRTGAWGGVAQATATPVKEAGREASEPHGRNATVSTGAEFPDTEQAPTEMGHGEYRA
jgi:hypothetical protein